MTRNQIIELIRSKYDPEPNNWPRHRGWDDGAEEIADTILSQEYDMRPPKPLTEPEAICTGFVRIVATPGPDTLRLTVQAPDRDTHFAMSPDECSQLAALLIRYSATQQQPMIEEDCV